MTTQNQDFEMWAGDYKTLEFTVTGVATAAAVAAAEWKMTRVIGATRSVTKTLSVVPPLTGGITVADVLSTVVVTVVLLAADTDTYPGTYRHELECTDTNGHSETVSVGTATVHDSLT